MFRAYAEVGVNDPVRVPTVLGSRRDGLLSRDMLREMMTEKPPHRERQSRGDFFVDDLDEAERNLMKISA